MLGIIADEAGRKDIRSRGGVALVGGCNRRGGRNRPDEVDGATLGNGGELHLRVETGEEILHGFIVDAVGSAEVACGVTGGDGVGINGIAGTGRAGGGEEIGLARLHGTEVGEIVESLDHVGDVGGILGAQCVANAVDGLAAVHLVGHHVVDQLISAAGDCCRSGLGGNRGNGCGAGDRCGGVDRRGDHGVVEGEIDLLADADVAEILVALPVVQLFDGILAGCVIQVQGGTDAEEGVTLFHGVLHAVSRAIGLIESNHGFGGFGGNGQNDLLTDLDGVERCLLGIAVEEENGLFDRFIIHAAGSAECRDGIAPVDGDFRDVRRIVHRGECLQREHGSDKAEKQQDADQSFFHIHFLPGKQNFHI